MTTVKSSWIVKKYLGDLYRSRNEYEVKKETAKAVLLSDGTHIQWVPKSCISESNSIDYEEMYRNAMQDVSFELVHDKDEKYKDVLALPLKPHQMDVLKTLKDSRRSYLGMEMGLGKTATSLAHILIQKEQYPVQVICEKGLMDQWWSEMMKFAPQLKDRFRVINYDKIIRDSCKEYLSELKSGKFFLILEEVSALGNEGAKRTEMSMRLSDMAFDTQMLSGSFFGGHFEKFYPCFRMQGFNGTRQDYDNLFTVKIPGTTIVRTRHGMAHKNTENIVGYKNIDLLLKKSSEMGAVFLRTEDCIDLPAMNISFVYTKLADSVKKYEASFFKRVEDMDEDSIRSMLVKIRRMNSIEENRAKLDAVKAMLDGSDDRFVIFYSFKTELDELVKICKKAGRPISQWNGDVKDRDAFDDYDNAVILVQPQSGAKGLNLQAANKMLFVSPMSSDFYIQAKKRINRIGQKRQCFYWIVCSDDSFERNAWNKVLKAESDVKLIG